METSVGALIATHNPAPHTLNVNTAPLALLEAAMRLEGYGGVDIIRDQRVRGRQAQIGARRARTDTGAQPAIQFISVSDRWAFRLDLRINRVRQSWWVIYGRNDRPGPRGPRWMCLQRLRVQE
jgi:hypothetical protein